MTDLNTITQFSEKTDNYCELVLWLACDNLPLSLPNSPYFKHFEYTINRSWRAPKQHVIRKKLKKLAMIVKAMVINQLSDKEVCLIVDEMTDNSGSHLNFMLSTNTVETLSGLMRGHFFWKSEVITMFDA